MAEKRNNPPNHPESGRRKFLKSTAFFGGAALIPNSLMGHESSGLTAEEFPPSGPATISGNPDPGKKSIIGSYGHWADGLRKDPPLLSFRGHGGKDAEVWRKAPMDKARELIASPDTGPLPEVKVHERKSFEDLVVEEISWQLPYGNPTNAVLLKPANAKGRLPAVLGLHDHAGKKYFGRRKITRTTRKMHPLIVEHQKDSYEGRAWANELARRGYVVLVPDAFTFASRRVMPEDLVEIPWGDSATRNLVGGDPEDPAAIEAYNRWSSDHEHILSKSLFCAGTTWPGVFLAEDRVALDVISQRPDVDPDRIGCAGLSGGGLRTVFLGGLDHRIRCAVAVGFMSTWSDFLLYKSFTHTWMTYVPLLPNYLEFPEILGLRVPLPTMTLNNRQDGLFTLPEMEKADRILQEIFQKAGAPDRYKGGFYEGPHKFDIEMQEDAFRWFDQWL